jgi:ATP-dependent helicase HrpB
MLDADAQDAALAPFDGRKVVLATNLAETSLTIEGVTDVIDTGLHRVPRRDPATGIDRLATERISRDSATQRAGRAGRTGPGRCLRLWDLRDEMRERREPEIERVDLAGPLLDVLAWGGDRRLRVVRGPPGEGIAAAMGLLERLGRPRGGRLTAEGEAMHRLPLHPRPRAGPLGGRGLEGCRGGRCARRGLAAGRLATRRPPTPTCCRPSTGWARRRRA